MIKHIFDGIDINFQTVTAVDPEPKYITTSVTFFPFQIIPWFPSSPDPDVKFDLVLSPDPSSPCQKSFCIENHEKSWDPREQATNLWIKNKVNCGKRIKQEITETRQQFYTIFDKWLHQQVFSNSSLLTSRPTVSVHCPTRYDLREE